MFRIPTGFRSRKVLCLFVFMAAISQGPAWAATNPNAFSDQYEDALVRFEKGDHKGAIIQLKSAIQKDPANLPARILLGRAYLASGFAISAAKEFTVARRAGADDAFTLVPLGKAYAIMGEHARILREIRSGNRGHDIELDISLVRARAHFKLRQLDEAQRAFNRVSQSRPDAIEPLLGLARVQMERGDLKYAEEFVGAAIFKNPENADVWFTSGDLKRTKRNLEDAIVDFAKAIDLDPNHQPARMGRAATLIDLGRHQDATEDVEHVREKNPLNPRAIYFHALILTQANKPKEAQAALDDASKLLEGVDPALLVETPSALLLAGVVAYFRQEFRSAQSHLTRYVEIEPHHVSARRILASLHLRQGEVKHAIAILKPAVKDAPRNTQILTMYGSALMKNRQYGEAANAFQRAAAASPEDAALQTKLGMSHLRAGQDDNATKALRTALALDSSDAQAAVLLSLTRMRLGKFKEALETIQVLIEQNPDNPFAHNMAGGARLGLGDLAGARASFEKTVALDPSYLSARFNLAQLDIRQGKTEDGEARYLAILKDSKKNARAMTALARIAEEKGAIKDAIRWLEKARFANPGLVAEQVHLIDLYIAQKNADTAVQIAQSLARKAPRSPMAVASLGRAEIAVGTLKNANRTYRRLSALAKSLKSADWLIAASATQTQIGDVEGAEQSLKDALFINPKHTPTLTALFNQDVRMGRLNAARKRAERLRKDPQNSTLGLTLLGDLALHQSHFSRAVSLFDAAFQQKRTTILLLRLRRALRGVGKNREMITLLENWVSERPADNAAQRALAAGYKETGQFDKSLKLHESLLQHSPKDPALLNNLALLYLNKGDARALITAEKAYKSAPNQAATADTYGWVLVQSGQESKGLQLLRNARVRAPKVSEIRYHIAAALNRLGRPKDALRELEAVLLSGGNFESAEEAHKLWKELSDG